MSNDDTAAAWRYHSGTKHSPSSVRHDTHVLDWENQPLSFKVYRDLPALPLPHEVASTGVPALTALVSDGSQEQVPTLADLAYLLFFSAGITKRKRYPGGEIAFRAASCTGALYEIDLYLACANLPDLAAGLYHFGPHDFSLRRLRAGDYRRLLARAAAAEPAVGASPVVIVCSGTYWRNAWKYRARTYRHFGWDNGTILANLLAAAAALDLPAGIACGFVDDTVNALLGLDVEREVALSIAAIGRSSQPPPDPPPVQPVAFDTIPLSTSDVDYPIMREVHAASSLTSVEEVAAWRESAARGAFRLKSEATTKEPDATPSTLVPLPILADDELPRDSIEDVIVRRGSTRRFDRGAAWTLAQLAAALDRATRSIAADFLPATKDTGSLFPFPAPGERTPGVFRDRGEGALLNDLYLIVHAVDGLAPGAYVLHRDPFGLEMLKAGNFRDTAGYLGLEQELPADASAVVFFLADLGAILDRLGNRGYRAAQLEAGIIGGRLYLAAYAQRLGATGLTFYDDDVVAFFSPHAAGKSAIFCVALGKSRSVGPKLGSR